MKVKAKSRPKIKRPIQRAKLPKRHGLPDPTNVDPKVAVRNAIPQKVLAYAARPGMPPAISDEVPEVMPFATDNQ
jgi:hypothetical protein